MPKLRARLWAQSDELERARRELAEVRQQRARREMPPLRCRAERSSGGARPSTCVRVWARRLCKRGGVSCVAVLDQQSSSPATYSADG